MSWWTEFRDGLETAAAVVVNYFYPGLGSLGYFVNSEGSQEQLNSVWGRGAMLASAAAGSGLFSPGTAASAAGETAAAEGAGEFASSVGPEAFDYSSAWANGGDVLADTGATAGSGMGDMGAFNDANYGVGTQTGTGGTIGTAGGQANPYDNFGDLRGGYTQGQGNVFNATGAGPGTFNAAGVNGGQSLGGSLATPAAAGKFAAGGTMPWSSPGGMLNTASGVLGLMGSGQLMGAAKNADPFAEQRRKYSDAMGRLAADPNSIYTMPGYRAGEQAVKRAMAAQGYTGSGNALAALQKYGGDFYNQTMNLYGGLAGANVNPVDAARLGLQGKQAGIELAGRSLGTLGNQNWMAGNQWPSFGG